jgi:hypothetical protein
MKIIVNMILLSSISLLLSACGGNGSSENWGIDHQGGNSIPISKCINNSQDASEAKATIVPMGTIVNRLSDNAILRVWHFQNAKKAACMVSGEAILIVNN